MVCGWHWYGSVLGVRAANKKFFVEVQLWFTSALYTENFLHRPQGSVLRGKYCYIEFLPKHSPMFSDVLRSHMTLFHPFRPTCPFIILTPSGFRSLSAAFPCQHHTHHINHGHNMPRLSWNHLGIFWGVMERHRKYHGYT